jgi:hypothetical protein
LGHAFVLAIDVDCFVCTRQAPIIHAYHYKRWRETGLAFELR